MGQNDLFLGPSPFSCSILASWGPYLGPGGQGPKMGQNRPFIEEIGLFTLYLAYLGPIRGPRPWGAKMTPFGLNLGLEPVKGSK